VHTIHKRAYEKIHTGWGEFNFIRRRHSYACSSLTIQEPQATKPQSWGAQNMLSHIKICWLYVT